MFDHTVLICLSSLSSDTTTPYSTSSALFLFIFFYFSLSLSLSFFLSLSFSLFQPLSTYLTYLSLFTFAPHGHARVDTYRR